MNRLMVIVRILVGSALRGLLGGRVTSGIAIATIAIALLLVGAFALLTTNSGSLMERFGDDLRITAFLEDGLSAEEQRALVGKIASAPGVERAELVDKDAALERFRRTSGGAELLEGLEVNPLPSSVEISLALEARTPEGLSVLEGALEGLPGVDELAHGREWIEGYARAASLLRVATIVLAGVLSLAALLIVANTIRLGVYAREDELDILELVGASRTFIRVPFLLEGTLQGAIGGALALGLLWLAFHLIVPELRYGLAFFLGNTEPRFFLWSEMLRLLVGGAGLGMIGAAAALAGGRAA